MRLREKDKFHPCGSNSDTAGNGTPAADPAGSSPEHLCDHRRESGAGPYHLGYRSVNRTGGRRADPGHG